MLTDILHWDNEQSKRVPLKDCEIVSNFLFAKRDYLLAKKGLNYYVCILSGDTPTLVWETPNTQNTLPGEVVSMFRNGYLKNSIKDNDIEDFIKDPVAYAKKRKLK